MREQGYEPSFPDIKKGRELLKMTLDIGIAKSGFSGPAPIEWVDLQAWSDISGVQLSYEEAKIIKKISSDYCSQIQKSKSFNAVAPYLDDNERLNGLNGLFDAI